MKHWKELGAVLLIVTALAFIAAKFGEMPCSYRSAIGGSDVGDEDRRGKP